MLIVHLVVAGIFLVLGTVFAFGKGAFLIAGYNTASAEEKAKYDEKKLCRAVSKLMFALAACWVVAALSEIFKNMIFLWVGIALFVVVTVVGVVWINRGQVQKVKFGLSIPSAPKTAARATTTTSRRKNRTQYCSLKNGLRQNSRKCIFKQRTW